MNGRCVRRSPSASGFHKSLEATELGNVVDTQVELSAGKECRIRPLKGEAL